MQSFRKSKKYFGGADERRTNNHDTDYNAWLSRPGRGLALSRRPDGFYGYDYVFLEDATWNALCEIARERGCTVDELCGDIELNFAPGEDFAPAARRYVLRYIDQVPDNRELPANFRALTELLGRHRTK
jgi:predicted DNA-binding ribbon-helix-helix protein